MTRERISLGEAAYRRLHDDIVSGRLAPGDRLTERGASEMVGMSLTSVREALTRLDHDGLVTTIPRKGYRVTALTLKDVDDLFGVWRIIAPEIVHDGLAVATAADRTELQELLGAAVSVAPGEAATLADAVRRNDLVLASFDRLAVLAGNDYLLSIFRRMASELRRLGVVILQAQLAEAPVDLPDIPRLFAADPGAAASAVRGYVERLRVDTLSVLSRWPSVSSTEIR